VAYLFYSRLIQTIVSHDLQAPLPRHYRHARQKRSKVQQKSNLDPDSMTFALAGLNKQRRSIQAVRAHAKVRVKSGLLDDIIGTTEPRMSGSSGAGQPAQRVAQ
jgi:hypothetical protein